MKKRKIIRRNRCQGRTAKNKLCGATCQRKYCKRHQSAPALKIRKSKKYTKNPNDDDDLALVLSVLEGEIEHLCHIYKCSVPGCDTFCNYSPYPRSQPSLRHSNPFFHQRRSRFLRRRNPYWSRPLSASFAKSFMGEEFDEGPDLPLGPPPLPPAPLAPPEQLPFELTEHKVLLVGGDKTYVPDWLAEHANIRQITQAGSDPEKELGDFFPDVVITYVRAEKANRPTRETQYNLRNFCQGANTQKETVPYITFHKGWSQALQRATELGLDWLRDAYPYQTYIPKEELEPAPPRAMTLARRLHNEKRAAKFAEKGITHEHVNYAQIRYIKDETSHCVLCGVKIKYQFRLLFDIPGQPEPTSFFPVGSVCITDWMEALPDTKGKLAFLIQARNELIKAEEVATEKKKASPSKEVAKERKKQQSEVTKQREKERKELVAKRKEEKRLERGRKKAQREAKAPKKPQNAPEISPETGAKMDDLQRSLWGSSPPPPPLAPPAPQIDWRRYRKARFY